MIPEFSSFNLRSQFTIGATIHSNINKSREKMNQIIQTPTNVNTHIHTHTKINTHIARLNFSISIQKEGGGGWGSS